MNEMEWALWSLDYLRKARCAIEDDFRGAMNELRGYGPRHDDSWYGSSKNIISTLYHFSQEFVADINIPCEKFASPRVFETDLANYRIWVQNMKDQLDEEDRKYRALIKTDEPNYLITVAQRQVENTIEALAYVLSKQPSFMLENASKSDFNIIVGLARRFHESVLSLKTHPYKGTVFNVNNEWDCQYLFRAILAAYIADIRDEEWNPSVAGSSARCEFFLKPHGAMIELKYVHSANDDKKIKQELAKDFLDYGANDKIKFLICLIYDPNKSLRNPIAVQKDLSGPRDGFERVDIIISPPRD